ncbi:hypothetical protein DID77_02220 [Candidatus Marinamargulisbacteria bacterium SCGC AG-439-L15]|nr:hypothetical protein DID77_02220 [Candidatus Marinamargulisbacteria bacterium SCGC AG-439-L15]
MKRIITGLLLIGIGVYVIAFGGIPLFLWILLVGGIITFEFNQLILDAGYQTSSWLSYILTGLFISSTQFSELSQFWHHPLSMLFIGVFMSFLFYELLTKRLLLPKSRILLSLRVSVVSGVLASFIILLRQNPNGLFLTWLCFLSIWCSDIFALYGGRLIGRTPLSPLSPKKTIEGSIVGTLSSLLVGGFYCYWMGKSLVLYLPIILLMSIVSQCGDLHESLTKRQLNAKDSSGLLPGHGGFYDRADSSLFVFPVFYYILIAL